MIKQFSENAWDDYLYWQKQDKKTFNRINKLLKETERSPFEGIGKPEPLKGELNTFWSRRIDQKHRFIYKVDSINGQSVLMIADLRNHYT